MALTILEDRILRIIGKHRRSISEIERDFFTMDRPNRRTIQRALSDMVRAGLIRQTGIQRGTRYEKK